MFTLVQGSKYLTTSFVQHVNGHFVAFVRCGGRWLKCDDSIVTDFVTPSTIWPTLIFLEKYRRRSILGPSALRPAAQVERLRSLTVQLSRAVLEAGCGSEAGHDVVHQTFSHPLRPVARFHVQGPQTTGQHASYEHANHRHGFALAWFTRMNHISLPSTIYVPVLGSLQVNCSHI